MRHERAAAQFDRDIADVLAHPLVDRLRLVAPVCDAGGDLVRQGGHLRRRRHLGFGDRGIGLAQFGEVLETGDQKARLAVHRRNGLVLHGHGRRRRIVPAIGDRRALLRLAEIHAVTFDLQRHVPGRGDAFAHIAERHRARKDLAEPELAGEIGCLGRDRHRVDRNIARGELREHDLLDAQIRDHRAGGKSAGHLVVDRIRIDGDCLAVRLEGVRLDDVHLLARRIVGQTRLSDPQRRGIVVRRDLVMIGLSVGAVGGNLNIGRQQLYGGCGLGGHRGTRQERGSRHCEDDSVNGISGNAWKHR